MGSVAKAVLVVLCGIPLVFFGRWVGGRLVAAWQWLKEHEIGPWGPAPPSALPPIIGRGNDGGLWAFVDLWEPHDVSALPLPPPPPPPPRRPVDPDPREQQREQARRVLQAMEREQRAIPVTVGLPRKPHNSERVAGIHQEQSPIDGRVTVTAHIERVWELTPEEFDRG